MKFLDSFSAWIQRKNSTRNLLVLAGLLIFILTIMETAPFGITAMKHLAGGKGMLDMEWGYSPATVRTFLLRLDDNGIGDYRLLLGLDIVFALVFAALQSLMITRLAGRAGISPSLNKLNLLPWLRGLLDFGENLLLFTLLAFYPALPDDLVYLASTVTLMKWIVYYGVIGVLLSLGILTAGKMGRKSRPAAAGEA